MRGRTLKHFFFLSEFNECYVPGIVLNSLARDEKTLYRKNRMIVLRCIKWAWDAAFPLFLIDLWAGEESAVPFENVKFEMSNRQLEKWMGPWAQEKCLLLWHRFGKRWVSGGVKANHQPVRGRRDARKGHWGRSGEFRAGGKRSQQETKKER